MDGQRALLQHKVTLDQSIIDAIQETIKKEVNLALHDQGHPVQADGLVATTNQTALFQGEQKNDWPGDWRLQMCIVSKTKMGKDGQSTS